MQLPRSYTSSSVVTSSFQLFRWLLDTQREYWDTLWAKTTPLFLVQPSLCEWSRGEGEKRESDGEGRGERRERGGIRGIRRIGKIQSVIIKLNLSFPLTIFLMI